MQNNFDFAGGYITKTINKLTAELTAMFNGNAKNNGYYFNVAVIKRHVDGHKSGNSLNRTIKQYFISSEEQLERDKDEIITLCEAFSARAYFDPQPRSWKDFANEMNLELAERFISNDFEKIHRIAYRAAAKCKRKAKWILDIDNPDELPLVKEFLVSTTEYIELEFPSKSFGRGMSLPLVFPEDVIEVKTHKGYHLIVPPFDTRVFVEKFKDVEVKKNNMTLLYYPNSLEKDEIQG